MKVANPSRVAVAAEEGWWQASDSRQVKAQDCLSLTDLAKSALLTSSGLLTLERGETPELRHMSKALAVTRLGIVAPT